MVPMPLLIGTGVILLLLFMYFALSFVSKKTSPGADDSPFYQPTEPDYATPETTQAASQPGRPWWEASVRREKEFRQDAYDAFKRQEFDTDKRMEKIEQDKEFLRMQRSVTKF